MAAHAGLHLPGFLDLIRRLRWPRGRIELDRRLAAADDPLATPALAHRAAILLTPRARRRLANGLERVVLEAERPATPGGAAIPVQRPDVLAARRELLLLAAALRGAAHPEPRGIAATSLLLTDGAGPMFSPHPPGELGAAARRAADMLEAT